MEPAAFDGENNVLGAPRGVTHEECGPLSVRHDYDAATGFPVVISCWKATPEELAEIQRTGRVWLVLWGPTMPPACVTGMRPF